MSGERRLNVCNNAILRKLETGIYRSLREVIIFETLEVVETRSFNTGVYVVRELRGDGVGIMVSGEYVLYDVEV